MATPEPDDLGGFRYGEYAVFTGTFAQEGAPKNPGGGPFCMLTPPGGTEADYSHQLTAQGSGVYKFVPVTNVPGDWSGRIYATGAGQTSRDVVWVVARTRNP